MQSRWMLYASLCAATAAYAHQPQPYQTGRLLQMNSVHCGTTQKDAHSALSEIVGTDDSSTKTQELLCQEYVLQADAVIYRIRPRDQKHPELLPVGATAQFRIQKDKLLLRVDGTDNKDHPYVVVSMTPRTDNPLAADADAAANHAQ
ncbi:MAG TPA: hypothetical protein VMD55_10120 [Terracidiphilus sp.]|nr:hypothetical protein [Terracidiphilus sp.]